MAAKLATIRETIWSAGIRDIARSIDGKWPRIIYRDMNAREVLLGIRQTRIDILQWALLENVRKTLVWIGRFEGTTRIKQKALSKRGLPF